MNENVDYPRLDEPGQPRTIRVGNLDQELQQTIRDNCITLAEEAGGEDKVTLEMIDAHPCVSRRDYGYWIMELLDHQKERDFVWKMQQAFIEGLELPATYLDRLGLRHLGEA
jgi:hypothetical protein